MPDPEKLAREEIDALLKPCGWDVQDKNAVNFASSRGVAVRELTFKTGEPDYTLFVDGKAIGTVRFAINPSLRISLNSAPDRCQRRRLQAVHAGRQFSTNVAPPLARCET
jgi:hypothetical protein